MTKANNDSDDLEALFDSIVSGSASSAAPVQAPVVKAVVASATDGQTTNTDVINKIGHMTRALHDSLRELGYDR
jgi:chemotaxis protein CheZ